MPIDIMRALVFVTTNIKPLLAAIIFGSIEVMFLPNPQLILYLFAAMLVDFLTGILKSWDAGQATTSQGFRKSAIKVGVYACVIIATWVLANLLHTMYPTIGEMPIDYSKMVNVIIGFLSFIELYSVFENIYAMAPNSTLSRYIAKPFLKFLRGVLDRADSQINSYGPKDDRDAEAK